MYGPMAMIQFLSGFFRPAVTVVEMIPFLEGLVTVLAETRPIPDPQF